MTEIEFRPEWNKIFYELRHSWAGIGNVDQFRWFVRADMQEHDEIGLRHVRAIGIFNDEMRILSPLPSDFRISGPLKIKRENFQIIDMCIDRMLDIGVKPMITTTFMPDCFTGGQMRTFDNANICPPGNMEQWSNLVKCTIEHFKKRYGLVEIRKWYYEVWNEPNLINCFWGGTKEEWFALWTATWKAIKSVDDRLRIGGPSTARGEWLIDFLNAAREKAAYPDYIATHIYNNDSMTAPLSPFDGQSADKVEDTPHFAAAVIKGVRKLLNNEGYKGELHWNEWGRSWFPHDPAKETPLEAAFIVKTMAEISREADYFAYWCLSDIYDQAGYTPAEFCGHYGMLSLHSLRKPSFFAHRLLNMLGNIRLQCSGGSRLENVIVSRKKGKIQVLAYLYPEKTGDGIKKKKINIKLPGKPFSAPVLFKIDSVENNIICKWMDAGSPAYPSRSDIAMLKRVNELTACSSESVTIVQQRQDFHATFELECPGVAFMEMKY